MSDIEREEFEQAVTDRWSDSYSFTRFGDEDYYDEVLEGMWRGWRARAYYKHSAPRTEGTESCDNCCGDGWIHAHRDSEVRINCPTCDGSGIK